MRRSEIELGIAFPLDDEKEKVVEKGVSYYPLSMPKLGFKEKFQFFFCKENKITNCNLICKADLLPNLTTNRINYAN